MTPIKPTSFSFKGINGIHGDEGDTGDVGLKVRKLNNESVAVSTRSHNFFTTNYEGSSILIDMFI